MLKIILASQSPYRRAQLEKVTRTLGLEFETRPSQFDEDQIKSQGLSIASTAMQLARAKAQASCQDLSLESVIGGDQIAGFESTRLDKPGNFENAFQTLKTLQGNEHRLYTAVSILHRGRRIENLNITTLKMKPLSDQAIEEYLKRDEPFDCAGAYKFELNGKDLFSEVRTVDATAIVGLPELWLRQTLSEISESSAG